jgi:hypothetical protein
LIKNLENIIYRFKSSLSTAFSQREGARKLLLLINRF